MGKAVRAAACAALLVGIFALAPRPGPAAAEGWGTWSGNYFIYSIGIPPGWKQSEGGGKATHETFESPDHRGQIMVGLTPTEGSLEDELEKWVRSAVTVGDRRRFSIHGVPCISALSIDDHGAWKNGLFCQITFPFDDGDRAITYYMASFTGKSDFDRQSKIFWEMVDTLLWDDRVGPVDDDGAYDDGQKSP